MKAFALSACPLSLHLDELLCGEDYFPHAYRYEAFAIFIGIPHLDEHLNRLSSPRVVTSIGSLLRISKLVNPFASCVWE